MSPTATATRPTAGSTRAPGGRGPTRRRTALTLGIVGLVVVLAATAGWLVYFSSVFSVQQVAVSGTRELDPAEIREAAQVPVGKPMIRQDLTVLAQRTAQLPQVLQVQVTRDWPGTVAIAVVERQPLLAVRQPQGYAIVDQHGVAYEVRGSIPKGVLSADVNPDDVALLTEVGLVASALPAGLKSQVTKIAATDRDDITVQLDSGVTVSWGSADQSPLKAEVTAALLKRKPQGRIDVSSPHNPAVR